MSETYDVYEQALKIREQKNKEKDAKKSGGGGGNFDYEVINWIGLEDNADTLIRIVGNPVETRTSPEDSKLIFWSKALNDSGSYCQLIWKQTQSSGKDSGDLDENWILNEFYSKVRSRKWEQFKTPIDGKKGKYIYLNEDSEAFKRIDSNKRETDKYPPRFYPGKKILLQAISRQSDWNVLNKHTSILSSKHNFWKNDDQGNPIYFTDPGIPTSIYDSIFENVVAFRKDYGGWNLDIIIRKSSKNDGKGKTQVDYIVKDILEDKLSPAIAKLGNSKPLTDEEKAYTKYNLDKLFPVSSYNKILKNLGNLFKIWDAETGDTFYDKLLDLAKIEKEDREKNKTHDDSEEPAEELKEKKVQTQVKKEEVQEEAAPKRGGVRQPISEKSDDESIEDLCKKHLPAWDKLNSTEKKFTIAAIERFDGAAPVYKEGTSTFPCECDDKFYTGTTKQPETVPECTTCFVCAKKFNIS